MKARAAVALLASFAAAERAQAAEPFDEPPLGAGARVGVVVPTRAGTSDLDSHLAAGAQIAVSLEARISEHHGFFASLSYARFGAANVTIPQSPRAAAPPRAPQLVSSLPEIADASIGTRYWPVGWLFAAPAIGYTQTAVIRIRDTGAASADAVPPNRIGDAPADRGLLFAVAAGIWHTVVSHHGYSVTWVVDAQPELRLLWNGTGGGRTSFVVPLQVGINIQSI